MANEKQVRTGEAKNLPAVTGEPTSSPSLFMFDAAQFKQLQRTLITTGVVMGLVASGKRPTPTLANLREVLSYVVGVEALLDYKGEVDDVPAR